MASWLPLEAIGALPPLLGTVSEWLAQAAQLVVGGWDLKPDWRQQPAPHCWAPLSSGPPADALLSYLLGAFSSGPWKGGDEGCIWPASSPGQF